MVANEKSGFAVKDLCIKVLFLVVCILLLLWFFPISKNVVGIKPLTDKIFAENINYMKAAARSYYINERLPQVVNEKLSMPLQIMYDRKMLIPFTDKLGNSCNTEESYIEVTKIENDKYILKTYLSCNKQTDYVIETLGCDDKCCTKEDKVVIEEEKPIQPTKRKKIISEYEYIQTIASDTWSAFGSWVEEFKAETSTLKREEKTVYKGRKLVNSGYYEYYHTKQGYSAWSTWSDWSKNYMAKTDLVDVEQISDSSVAYSDYTSWSAWSRTKPTTTLASDLYEIKEQTSTIYGGWYFYENKSSLYPLYSTDLTRVTLLDENYMIRICVDGCCEYKTGYLYQIEKRTSSTVTEYSIHTRTKIYNGFAIYRYRTRTSVPEYTWSDSSYLSGWTYTGTSRHSGSNEYIYTDWVDKLPSGYTEYQSKKLYHYSTKSTSEEVKYTWSTETSLNGWTKTGNTKNKTIYY